MTRLFSGSNLIIEKVVQRKIAKPIEFSELIFRRRERYSVAELNVLMLRLSKSVLEIQVTSSNC
ncbi:MAG TPA: hypothetical protein V6C71_06555 [Coleofasciculaceae cyanobacterium]